ncbi:hypothetical protein [Halocatena marina]|uniref:hypothetical protein n=2 Tax=Halocatena marina TaxID=2934937 RepID=UPI00200D84A6|nr:hypothetical protein [Halocatena marina]
MSRRRLLSSLLGAGFTQSTASYLTKADIDTAASDEVPIVVGFHSETPSSQRTPIKRYVPADWYNDFRHATQMKDRLTKLLRGLSGIVSIGVIPGDRGGENAKLLVRIQHTLFDSMLGEIPVHIGGVAVTVEAIDEITPLSCRQRLQGWNASQSSIYGGYAISGDNSTPIGSVGAPAFKNGRRYLATTQHIFAGSNASGKTLKHPDGTALGTVEAAKCREDFAMVRLNSNYHIERSIRYSGYNGIAGHYSSDGIGYLKSHNVKTQKVGQSTCRTTFARIQSIANTIYTAPGCVPKPYTVVHKSNSNNKLKRGDSGAISFHEAPNNSNKCWLISFMNYEDSGKNTVFGTGLYRLANFGYHF